MEQPKTAPTALRCGDQRASNFRKFPSHVFGVRVLLSGRAVSRPLTPLENYWRAFWLPASVVLCTASRCVRVRTNASRFTVEP